MNPLFQEFSAYAIISVACPGTVIEITPAQVHIKVLVLFNAGMLPRITVGEPGVQGAAVAGTHGIGVSTPMAAEVAEATLGLASDVHMPNGRILTMGTLSIMFAAGT